ncbi:unnamed protein product [Absidia cylindrospora]
MNPRKRYTINQFLKHPWMLQKAESISTTAPTDTLVGEKQESEAELFKKTYNQRNTTTSSGQSTPSERRRILEPSMKEIYDVCLDMARDAEEKKLKKRAKKQPQVFDNSIYNIQEDDDDDEASNTSNNSGDDSTSDSDNDDSTSEPSTEDNNQTDLEIEALHKQLNQMMSAAQLSESEKTGKDDEITQLTLDTKDQQTTAAEPIKRIKVRKPQALFELKMDNATLLEKRRKNAPLP